MTTKAQVQFPEFDLLSVAAQQRLRARVADAVGSIDTVVQEVSAQLTELDQSPAPDTPSARRTQQGDRAFLVAQLTYLDRLAHPTTEPEQPRKRGILVRLRSRFGRAQTAE